MRHQEGVPPRVVLGTSYCSRPRRDRTQQVVQQPRRRRHSTVIVVVPRVRFPCRWFCSTAVRCSRLFFTERRATGSPPGRCVNENARCGHKLKWKPDAEVQLQANEALHCSNLLKARECMVPCPTSVTHQRSCSTGCVSKTKVTRRA